jgi:Holliday junction resolvasome RuvABC endonuclease subunit
MNLLALDLGTETGYCIGSASSRVSGVQSFRPRRFDGGGMRFLRFRRWLNDMVEVHPVERIAFEEVRRHAGNDAAHAYGGFMAHLTAWCEEFSVPYEAIPVGHIKKHWTGKGNANKDAMIEASRSRGFEPADDNEADAQALFDFVISNEAGRVVQ